jgi:hypothetical protein
MKSMPNQQTRCNKMTGELKDTVPSIKELLDILSSSQTTKHFWANTRFLALDKTPLPGIYLNQRETKESAANTNEITPVQNKSFAKSILSFFGECIVKGQPKTFN